MDFNKLIARVKNILLTPKTEWPAVAAESDTVQGLFKNYIMILAAIPAVIGFISKSIIGVGLPLGMGTFRLGIGWGITDMIVTYAGGLIVVYLLALIVDALAPTFNGEKNPVQALKSVAYAWTAAWIAGIFSLLGVGLAFLVGIAALIYGIYLLYLGLPHTMKCPQEKAGGYAAATIVIGFVLSIVVAVILGTITGVSGAAKSAMGGLNASSAYTLDKDSPLAKLNSMSERVDAAGKKLDAAEKSGDKKAQMEAAGQMLGAVLGGGAQVEALAPDALKPFVPNTLAGLPRTGFSVQKQAPMGMQVSIAEARYGNNGENGPSYELIVTDAGSAKGLMQLAGFGAIEREEQTENGYEKTYHQDGRLVHEEWNKSGNGEYTIVLGDRFVVAVKGSRVPSADALKTALAGIDLAGLEALKAQGVKKG